MKPVASFSPLAGVACLISSFALFPVQGASVFSWAFYGYGKDSSESYADMSDSSTVPLLEVSADGSIDFKHTGNPGETLTFSASTLASAASQRLRTHASGQIENTHYDPDYDYETDTGTPSYYTSWAEASYTETLSYGGTATNYISTYIMRLTGDVSGVGTFTLVEISHGNEPSQSWFFSDEGSYNNIIVSQAFVHGGAPQEITVRILSSFQQSMEFQPDGDYLGGSANFGNTLEVLGVDLRDDQGNLLTGETITSDAGTSYAIIAVPEPCTTILASLAVFAYAVRRRAA
ncbi:PEP-CTERM sorting domain-containing protein [Roseibacillus ishigakijimensis]|uniref:PEP-CTERM sorting domain-containing protein n=1 Tax=Roseibacillus ishigakijimensis TaxID=454146 RepID=A0A934RQJ2_9BACT|nr:PEP-CTERM sorting domain-containing protein [Roseibacillus ishigakijimensis]MBK1833244.1 PEP-CTERM sorting domain-containing protein [Roseibacillus ishigakijimensis]